MNNFTFRLAQKEDLSAIVSIYNSTIDARQSTADLQPITTDGRQTWFDAHQNPHRPLYVLCKKNKEVVAFCALSDYHPREAYRISAEISVYIASHFRAQGLGRHCVSFMLKQAEQLGIHNILALIFAHNTASVRLFEQAGFQLWGRLPEVCDMQGILADVLILGKKIKRDYCE